MFQKISKFQTKKLLLAIVTFALFLLFTFHPFSISVNQSFSIARIFATQKISNSPLSLADTDILDFSSYLGGTGDEKGLAAALNYLGCTVVDSDGNIIIIGRTASIDFPIKDAYQATNHGSIDITVSKFAPNGSLLFSTYFGGSGDDWATSVALDPNDNIVFVGNTESNDFPLKNPYQDTFLGGTTETITDCFITKLSKNGQSLLYSSYFCGSDSDWCNGVSVDPSGCIAITGSTYSDDLPLKNAYQSTVTGLFDSYVALFNSAGSSLLFSTFIGSIGLDAGRSAVFNEANDVLVVGHIDTSSHGTEGVFQESYGGGTGDCYLAKFFRNGTLDYFSYLGGSSYDRANDLVIDNEGNTIITGYTTSSTFPVDGAYQSTFGGVCDAFVTKVDPSGQNILFSTFLGGSNTDNGYSLTIDSNDDIVITGQSDSTNFPRTYNSSIPRPAKVNVLATKLASNGSTLIMSALFGGSEDDIGVGVEWHSNNSFVIVGFTHSTNFPLHNPFQSAYGGNCDMFIMKGQLFYIPYEIPTETPTEPPTNSSTNTPTVTNDIIYLAVAITVVISILTLLQIRKRFGKT